MSKMRTSVDGASKLRDKLAELPDHIRAGAEQAVGEETEEIADDMRRFAPEAKGDLKRGIQAEHEGLSGLAASTARHADFVEHGTSRSPEQPYARPAAELSRRRFPKRLKEDVGVEIGKVTK